MRKIADIVPTPTHLISRAMREATPAQTLIFLQGAQRPNIRTKLLEVGWSADEVRLGWNLLLALNTAPLWAIDTPTPFVDAVAVCNRWTKTLLPRACSTLLVTHPDAAWYLFEKVPQTRGVFAALALGTFLDRLAAWQSHPPHIKREVLAIMQQLGLGPKELADATNAVLTVKKARMELPAESDGSAAIAFRDEIVRKMHAWHAAWAEVVSTLRLQHGELLALGIATPKRDRSTAPGSSGGWRNARTLHRGCKNETALPSRCLSCLSDGQSSKRTVDRHFRQHVNTSVW